MGGPGGSDGRPSVVGTVLVVWLVPIVLDSRSCV